MKAWLISAPQQLFCRKRSQLSGLLPRDQLSFSLPLCRQGEGDVGVVLL
jgi:hypothetical protein